MQATMTTVQSRDDVAYETLRDSLRVQPQPLFTTDVTGLFDVFLGALPDEHRQHYTCHACRRFIEAYGGLVTISERGVTQSAVWPTDVPLFFAAAVDAMLRLVSKANVTGVFLSDKSTWGTPVTGEWTHFAIKQAPVYRHQLKTPHQAMAEKAEDYKILSRSLHEFSLATIDTAITLLQTESLYRSEKCLGVAEWFKKVHQCIVGVKNAKTKANLTWRAVAEAPTGYCHVRSTMIGTLLEDIQAGMSFDAVSRRFAEKMSQYQRSQVAPTVGNVQQAEKIVEKLGLQNSLQRRYMGADEIPVFVWRPRVEKVAPGGVFAGVATKQKSAPQPGLEVPVTTMTWDKFQRTVLPTATKIEVKVENSNRFAALVTAVHPDSPNIFQWDNAASWYYHGGVDAEIKRRVENAGGRYEGNEIRCSLAWDNYTDLDLHCVGPGGHIYFGNKQDRLGGWLDVDANGGSPTTTTPVENIRWATAHAGVYLFYIHNYKERADGRNWYKAELEVNGKVFSFEGVIGYTESRIDLASFRYEHGVAPAIRGNATPAGTAWNLTVNQFCPVTAIVKSPNLWGDNPVTHAGDHTFFLIDGCQDTTEGKGRGFFNEMLKPELREIRKTLEAYTANTPIAGGDSATACGLGYSKDGEWGVTLRVTTGTIVATYKLDRWD